MTLEVYDTSAAKRAASVSVNADLLARAKAFKINLSQALESRLAELVAEHQRRAWLEENKEAIEAYNEFIERVGVFAEDERTF